jgi:hypothetical protein
MLNEQENCAILGIHLLAVAVLSLLRVGIELIWGSAGGFPLSTWLAVFAVTGGLGFMFWKAAGVRLRRPSDSSLSAS